MKLTTFLRYFVNGWCPSRKLPATLDLTGIRRSMRRLWNASIRHLENRVVLEHAATLVFDTEGKVRLVHSIAGAPDGVVPNYGSRKTWLTKDYDVAEGENFVGTFHTHPYENGLTGVAALKGEKRYVREEAAWALGKIGDARAVEHLEAGFRRVP